MNNNKIPTIEEKKVLILDDLNVYTQILTHPEVGVNLKYVQEQLAQLLLNYLIFIFSDQAYIVDQDFGRKITDWCANQINLPIIDALIPLLQDLSKFTDNEKLRDTVKYFFSYSVREALMKNHLDFSEENQAILGISHKVRRLRVESFSSAEIQPVHNIHFDGDVLLSLDEKFNFLKKEYNPKVTPGADSFLVTGRKLFIESLMLNKAEVAQEYNQCINYVLVFLFSMLAGEDKEELYRQISNKIGIEINKFKSIVNYFQISFLKQVVTNDYSLTGFTKGINRDLYIKTIKELSQLIEDSESSTGILFNAIKANSDDPHLGRFADVMSELVVGADSRNKVIKLTE